MTKSDIVQIIKCEKMPHLVNIQAEVLLVNWYKGNTYLRLKGIPFLNFKKEDLVKL
jgi:hypothetical protein